MLMTVFTPLPQGQVKIDHSGALSPSMGSAR